MSEEITFDDIEFGEPIEEREPNYRDGYIRGIYRARNIIDSKQKEIERLNNIINELEKWLKYKKEQMEEFELYKRKETGAFWYSTMGNIETFIERIQELKGSDSNE